MNISNTNSKLSRNLSPSQEFEKFLLRRRIVLLEKLFIQIFYSPTTDISVTCEECGRVSILLILFQTICHEVNYFTLFLFKGFS